jgi:hypothetical protein
LSTEIVEKIVKLEKQIEILQHAKESDTNKVQHMKYKMEKKIKKLQDKCNFLENDVKEKEKENKLHEIKMKDFIRTQNEFRKSGIKKLPKLSQSAMDNHKDGKKVGELNSTRYKSDGSRSISIDPKRVILSSKSRINTNRKGSIKISSLANKMTKNETLQIKKNSDFEIELNKASQPQIAKISTDSALIISEANNTEPVNEKSRGVTFAPDTMPQLNTEVPEYLESPLDPKDDKFENLGGDISFINMD